MNKLVLICALLLYLPACGGGGSSEKNAGSTHKKVSDIDGDGIADKFDVCPTVSNPDQSDSDNDGVGDDCGPASWNSFVWGKAVWQ